MSPAMRRFDASKAAAPLPPRDKSGWQDSMRNLMLEFANSRPRNVQVEIGPSSVGQECDRHLVYALSGFPSGYDSNPHFSMIGSAMHTLWEEMLEWDNLRAKLRGEEEPWLIEQEVKIRPPAVPKGSLDVFHKPTGTVLDWKHLGSSSLMKISSKGPGDVYRTQLHTYGYGLEEMGYNVNTVVLFAIPRSPTWGVPFMHESVVWSEPYDRQLAVDALDRVEGLFKDAKRLNATANIMKLQTVKATPGDSCMFCPLNGMMEGKRRVCPESK